MISIRILYLKKCVFNDTTLSSVLSKIKKKITLFEYTCVPSIQFLESHSFGSWFLLQDDNTLCPRLRNAKVEDLRSLTNFFGSCTETFVLAVNILDRFLALMKVFKHFCVCIFYF